MFTLNHLFLPFIRQNVLRQKRHFSLVLGRREAPWVDSLVFLFKGSSALIEVEIEVPLGFLDLLVDSPIEVVSESLVYFDFSRVIRYDFLQLFLRKMDDEADLMESRWRSSSMEVPGNGEADFQSDFCRRALLWLFLLWFLFGLC